METRPRGRPRNFDRTQALDTAMRLFWERGFDGTSIADLACAVGVRSASLYAAFGDKHDLFAEAVERYHALHGTFIPEALAASPTRKAVEALLGGAAKRFTEPSLPSGCLVVSATLNCGSGSPATVAFLENQRAGLLAAVRDRLTTGSKDDEVPRGADIDELAVYVVLMFEALSTGARRGIGRAGLRRHARRSLGFWRD